nr:MAG TPA: hypothetical protein [Caudoviricetes sp.]
MAIIQSFCLNAPNRKVFILLVVSMRMDLIYLLVSRLSFYSTVNLVIW